MKRKILFAVALISGMVVLFSTMVSWTKRPGMTDTREIRQSVIKSLHILEKSGYTFIQKSHFHCASCHHNTLTSMAADIAWQKGIALNDSFALQRVEAMVHTIRDGYNSNIIDDFIPAKFAGPYILFGLHAEHYAPSVYTDLVVEYLMNQARPDGTFQSESGRIPLETGEIHLTAMTIRSIV
ncbi:MAG TPA: hypothetical protein VK543_01590, partial [Puia sp.]|nr:hypothetical protein [Puia sp.]